MTVTPVLKGARSAEVADLTTWTTDSDEICMWIELTIGLPDSDVADTFQVCIASQSGLKQMRGGIGTVRGGAGQARPIVIREYTWGAVLGAIRNRLESCAGASWAEIQQKLRRQFD